MPELKLPCTKVERKPMVLYENFVQADGEWKGRPVTVEYNHRSPDGPFEFVVRESEQATTYEFTGQALVQAVLDMHEQLHHPLDAAAQGP